MGQVTYIYGKTKKTIKAKKGETLLQLGLDSGMAIEHACGGNGFCTTCLCHVKSGMENLSERNDREENMGVIDDPDRLSCQAKVEGDGDVEVEVVNA